LCSGVIRIPARLGTGFKYFNVPVDFSGLSRIGRINFIGNLYQISSTIRVTTPRRNAHSLT